MNKGLSGDGFRRRHTTPTYTPSSCILCMKLKHLLVLKSFITNQPPPTQHKIILKQKYTVLFLFFDSINIFYTCLFPPLLKCTSLFLFFVFFFLLNGNRSLRTAIHPEKWSFRCISFFFVADVVFATPSPLNIFVVRIFQSTIIFFTLIDTRIKSATQFVYTFLD